MRSKLEEFSVTPIGIVAQSSYQHKWGTPRQGMLAPTSTAVIQLSASLKTHLSSGDRVAVLWYAHLNGEKFNPLKARIKPPKLASTVGVFATRGVHRPSSIGLSFCVVAHVSADGKSIHVRGADMIQDTPVLNVISYIDLNVSYLDKSQIRMPAWAQNVEEAKIFFSLSSIMSMQLTLGGISHCDKVIGLVKSILSQDPRSIHSIRKHVDPIYEVDLQYDGRVLWIIYQHVGEKDINVVSITFGKRLIESHRSRTGPWLTELQNRLPFLR